MLERQGDGGENDNRNGTYRNGSQTQEFAHRP
jgi:hypothetical protein